MEKLTPHSHFWFYETWESGNVALVWFSTPLLGRVVRTVCRANFRGLISILQVEMNHIQLEI